MKNKRTLFSLVVFFSSFGFLVLLGFNSQPYNKNFSKEADNKVLHDLNTKGIDGSRSYVPVSESIITRSFVYNNNDPQKNQVDPVTSTVFKDLYAINTMQIRSTVIYDNYPPQNDSQVESEFEMETGFEMETELVVESDLEVEDEPAIEDETRIESELSVYSDIGISIAKSYVNIREKPNTDSDIKGKLHKDSAAKILDSIDDWYLVESGSVKGFVNKKYIKTGLPDDELIKTYGKLGVSVNTDGLNVREKPSTDSKKLTVIYKNEHYNVIKLEDDWIKIDITDENITGYINSEYVELLVAFQNAVSKEEEEELIRLQEEEEKKLKNKQEEERIKKETQHKHRDEVDYTEDELKLLACLVHAEAGNQSYEGKLAVANVVLNRVKSRKYPGTIKDVIYQSGQFSVASSGSLDKQLKRYKNYSSKSQLLTIKAAKAALEGTNNIGDRLYFNGYKTAIKSGYDKKKTSVKIGDHLFW